jgi:hypothetical protein
MSALSDTLKTPVVEPSEKARVAIGYLLARIQDDPEVAWHFIGTESYSKLIGAYASLTQEDRKFVEESFRPRGSYCCRRCLESEGRR